ncbi:uncharacterized protein LOC136758569 [Amia ocellicauda]|uniref:uncharacterized protein LOC136758569 n=1 Tax=Amia ocellicauda TaxID=2972642 RepID=UPI003463E701
MRDPCRVCGSKLQGNQCRWIFSSSGKRNLQVILSYVLGTPLTRDGRGEFLCSKCVFMLEKVVSFDVVIGQLQGACDAKVQKLLAEKDNLTQCIHHMYYRRNPQFAKTERECLPVEAPTCVPVTYDCGIPEEGSCDTEICQGNIISESQAKDSTSAGSRMRRCLNNDTLQDCVPDCNTASPPPLRRSGGDGSLINPYIQSRRSRSQSMYLDLVHRRCSTPGLYRSRSVSLRSVSPDRMEPYSLSASSTLLCISPRKASGGDGHEPSLPFRGRSRRKDSYGSSFAHAPLIREVLKILRSIPHKPLLILPKSKIPVLLKYAFRRPASGCSYAQSIKKKLESDNWQSLQDLTEDFNDEYMPVKAEVMWLYWFSNKQGKDRDCHGHVYRSHLMGVFSE